MKQNFLVILCFFISLPSLVLADDVSFKLSAPQAVSVGERFPIKYTLNEKPQKFYAPKLEHFNIIGGPSTSSSRQIRVINGKVTKNISYTYTYYLQAKEKGKFKLPPAKVEINGKTATSNNTSITVHASGGSAKKSSQGGTSQSNKNGNSDNQVDEEQLFIRVMPNDRSVYQNEALVVTIKLFSRVELSGIQNPKIPSFKGFIKEEIKTADLRSLQKERINGTAYYTGVLGKYLLFPQRSGDLTIEPYQLDCIYRKRVNRQSRSPFNSFFDQYRNFKKTIKSDPVTINIKPLPANKPKYFSGAVGDFQISANIDKKNVVANNAIHLDVNISGTGNISLIDKPHIDFPPDFEVYDPEISVSTKNTDNGTRGKKTFEYLIIPRHRGKYRIPPIVFHYFDPEQEQYKSLNSNAYTVQVKAGEKTEGSGNVVSGVSKEKVKSLGKDIRFIKTNQTDLNPIGSTILQSPLFYGGYAVAFILFGMIVFVRRQQIKRNSDLQKVRNRKANSYARKRLKYAAKYKKQNEQNYFYEAVQKALWGYVSDKLNIPVASLNKEAIHKSLSEHGISADLIQSFLSVIDDCEFARYAPASTEISMEDLYSKAIQVISNLENSIK